MEQIALQFDRPTPTELLAQLDLTASPVGSPRSLPPAPEGRGPRGSRRGRSANSLDQARREIAEYLAGERTFFTVPVDLSKVPEFDRGALDVAATIPYGEVRSYKWIAEELGKPDAARAVGGRHGRNPVPLIVPVPSGGEDRRRIGRVLLRPRSEGSPAEPGTQHGALRRLRLDPNLLSEGLRPRASHPRGRPDPFRVRHRRQVERVPRVPGVPAGLTSTSGPEPVPVLRRTKERQGMSARFLLSDPFAARRAGSPLKTPISPQSCPSTVRRHCGPESRDFPR